MTEREREVTHKLNYIGAKAKLAPWICDIIGVACRSDPRARDPSNRVADLFCGSGDITMALRGRGFATTSIDAEVYATAITRARATGVLSAKMASLIAQINALSSGTSGSTEGAITVNYSAPSDNPADGRAFFTRENALRIDAARAFIARQRAEGLLDDNEFAFLVASLINSADRVANIAAVYGAFLKSFKQSALAPFRMIPIHSRATRLELPSGRELPSRVRCRRLPLERAEELARLLSDVEVVYMDPPYNGRQYSKNYFVLNAIADVEATELDIAADSVTGILRGCYVSPFCQVRAAERHSRRYLRKSRSARECATSLCLTAAKAFSPLMIFARSQWKILDAFAAALRPLACDTSNHIGASYRKNKLRPSMMSAIPMR
jgi:adenine-specific DNA-methyltransferase